MLFGAMSILKIYIKIWGLVNIFVLTFFSLLLSSFATYRMARHVGFPHPWLAFLPLIGHLYIMGKLAESSGFHRTGRNRWPSLWYPFWSTILILSVAVMVLEVRRNRFFSSNILTGVFLFSWIATVVLSAYVLYSILWDRLRQRAGLYTFLSMILPLEGIFLLLVMDLVPRSVTGHKQYLDGQPRYDKNHQWSPPPPKKSAKPKKNR